MPDLDERLGRARTDLLDGIDQPPLAQIAGRATALRRRRHATRAGAALAAVLAVAVLLVRPWSGSPAAEVPPAGGTQPAGPVYADLGITINGLEREAADLPGAIADVEFADPDHGYLVTTARAFASTADGGLTWQRHELPDDATADIILFDDGTIALPDRYLSADGGKTWRLAQPQQAPVPAAGEHDLLRFGPPQNTLQVWSPDTGYRGDLTGAVPITPTWVASRPTADGTWWIGGVSRDGSGRPAVAFSRDGGQAWQQRVLPAPAGSSVQVSVLGRHAYAIVLGADREIRAILHSADGGNSFTLTHASGGGEPATLAGDAQLRPGEAVPLLDGRLLITARTEHWYVSSDDGATFAAADGSLPLVGAIRRTSAGYVAYDLFGPEPAGWVAFSSDGSTWRKLHVR